MECLSDHVYPSFSVSPVAEDKTDDIVMSWIDKNGIFGYQLVKGDNEAQEGLETEFINVRVLNIVIRKDRWIVILVKVAPNWRRRGEQAELERQPHWTAPKVLRWTNCGY